VKEKWAGSQGSSFDCQDIVYALRVVGGHSTIQQLALVLGLARGLTETVLRSGLYALVKRGRLARSGRGKEATFAMGAWPEKHSTVDAKKAKSAAGWDGHWHVLTYDILTQHNALRMRLTRFLHDAGFGSLCASSWASPYDWEDELRGVFAGRDDAGSASYIRSLEIAPLAGKTDPRSAQIWELDALSGRYADIAARCIAACKDNSPTGSRRRAATCLTVARELRRMEAADPMLPPDLLPEKWPGSSAAKNFERLRAHVRRDVEKLGNR
jgi:phenylacetic acid degradation operon negative regulatory protein